MWYVFYRDLFTRLFFYFKKILCVHLSFGQCKDFSLRICPQFLNYDIPRILEQLQSMDVRTQLRAAREVSHLCRATGQPACAQCGHVAGFPGDGLDDHVLSNFLARLAVMAAAPLPIGGVPASVAGATAAGVAPAVAALACDPMAEPLSAVGAAVTALGDLLDLVPLPSHRATVRAAGTTAFINFKYLISFFMVL
jgi:hypothetical protein